MRKWWRRHQLRSQLQTLWRLRRRKWWRRHQLRSQLQTLWRLRRDAMLDWRWEPSEYVRGRLLEEIRWLDAEITKAKEALACLS